MDPEENDPWRCLWCNTRWVRAGFAGRRMVRKCLKGQGSKSRGTKGNCLGWDVCKSPEKSLAPRDRKTPERSF